MTDRAEQLAPLIKRLYRRAHAIKLADGPRWVRAPFTKALLAGHLDGSGRPCGLAPITPGSAETAVGLIDFDSHRGETPWEEMLNIASAVGCVLEEKGHPVTCFRSSGGHGVHLYVIWEAPQSAAAVRALLADALAAIGMEVGTGGVGAGEAEVFPKQNSVPADGLGSMWILPCSGKSVLLDWPLLGDDLDGEIVWRWAAPLPAVEAAQVFTEVGDAGIVSGAVDHAVLRAALDALPNADLDYERWRDVIFSIHSAGGSLDDAERWSAKSIKHNSEFLCERVWPYIKSERAGRAIGPELVLAAAARAGWQDPRLLDDYGVIPEPVAGAAAGGAPAKSPRGLRKIPLAKHLCTDHANVKRLERVFGKRLVVIAGQWHAWVGTHWAPDESEIYRCAMNLSKIIGEEADVWAAKPFTTTDEQQANLAIAEALKKWGAKSEAKWAIEAALGLLAKNLAVDSELVNADPWSLNVLNGTIDLRIGQLRPHNPDDLITRLVHQSYDPVAPYAVWEATIAKVTLEEQLGASRPLAHFLKRWFGYCATGVTREQKFVVHYGLGSNGKSTVLDTIADVLGEYATVAPPGLMVASGNGSDRHPTEIASLFGRRMVTAHESDDGSVLREGFIKQATGSDKLSARYMRQDFFKFAPTHKLQLLTNFKPQVKGQDLGIWRRVLLVPYQAKFGPPADVIAGRATHVRDTTVAEKLAVERPGILRWLVEGAVEWYRDGLEPPDVVLAASRDYRSEQDKVGQFVLEEAVVELSAKQPLQELFSRYQSWAKLNGYFPLGKRRFQNELDRVIPGYRVVEEKLERGGVRRGVTVICGIKLQNEL